MESLVCIRKNRAENKLRYETRHTSEKNLSFLSFEMRHHLSVSTSNVLSQFEEFKSEVKGKRLVVFLDYDGTLTPIVNDPKQALLAPEMKELLKQLKEYFITGIISGRSLKKIENFIGIDGLFYAGSHGFDITGPNRGLIRNEVRECERIHNCMILN